MISHNINHFKTQTFTKWKTSVAERANRTIKTRIYRWMNHNKNKIYIKTSVEYNLTRFQKNLINIFISMDMLEL